MELLGGDILGGEVLTSEALRDKSKTCEICGVVVSRHSHLIRHMRIHTGVKPFPCEVCGSAFSRREHLTRHMRMHTGEKPYTCEICGSTFSRYEHMKKHMQKHIRLLCSDASEDPAFLTDFPLEPITRPLQKFMTTPAKHASTAKESFNDIDMPQPFQPLSAATRKHDKKDREIVIDIDDSEEDTKSMKPGSAVHHSMKAPKKQKQTLVVPNHQKSVMSNLSSLWKARRLCDAIISNGTVNVKVHKLLLGAVCPKLLDVFYNTAPDKLPKVTFPSSVSEEALLAFAEYMYNGILDLDLDLLTQMKTIARRLHMKNFEQLCNNQLKSLLRNMRPTFEEPMLSEPCTYSGLLQQSNETEMNPAPNRSHQKDGHSADSSNSIPIANNKSNVALSNLPLVEVGAETDDNLMEIVNNTAAFSSGDNNIDDKNTSSKPQIKIEKDENYDRETALSNIANSSSSSIPTSNYSHFSNSVQPQSSSSATLTSQHTSSFPHSVLSPSSSSATSQHPSNFQHFPNATSGNLVTNVDPNNPYPMNLYTSNWSNMSLPAREIKNEFNEG